MPEQIKKSKMTDYHKALFELAKEKVGDLSSSFKRITESDAKTLGVERVSIWLFNEDRSEIICKDLFRLNENLHEEGLRLQAHQYPRYFQALKESRIIAVYDAHKDPRTNEFAETYLKPIGISSMLDVPIRLHETILGVVCHEHVGPKRKWSIEDQDFAASIADMVSLTLETFELKKSEEAIRRRDAILQAVSFAAETFLKSADWVKSIPDVLMRAGKATGASRTYLFENHRSQEGDLLTSQRYEWVAPSITPQINNPDMQNFSYKASGFSRLEAMLSLGQPFQGIVREFSERERKVLSAQNIQSILIVPVIVENEWWGFIGFDECLTERQWSEAEVDALRSLAGILGGAIQHKKAEEALRESEGYLKNLISSLPVGVMVVDSETHKIIDLNPYGLEMIGLSKDSVVGQVCHQYVCPAEIGKCPITDLKQTVDSSERILIKGNGERISILKTVVPTILKSRKYLLEIFIDLSERKKAENALRESEERYRTILENIEDGYYEVDLEGNLTFFNEPVCRMLGYSREELIGMNSRQYTDEQNAKILYQAFNNVYRTGIPIKGFEWEVVRKDGAKRYGEVSVSLIRNTEGQPIGFRGIVRDTTERKKAEEALAQSEERYRTLVEESFDGIWVQKGMKITFANRSLHKMLGYEEGELEGLDHWLVYHPDYQNLTRERAQARFRGEAPPSTYEVKFLRKDGTSFWGEIHAKVIHYFGEPGIQVWARDISEHKQAEKALQESQEKFKFLAEKMADVVWTMDLNFQTTYVSPSIEKILGFTPEERMRQPLEQMVTPESLKKIQSLFQEEVRRLEKKESMDPDRSMIVEVEYYHKNGSAVWMENTIKAMLDPSGKWIGIYGVSRDITERKRAEEILHNERERFRSLSENAPFGMAMIDKDGAFKYINPKFKELFGYDLNDIPNGKTWLRKAYPDPDHRHQVISAWLDDLKSFKPGEKRARIFTVTCKDGTQKIINFIPVQLETGENLMTCEDITDLKQAEKALRQTEEQLRHSQKMEAIGGLAGGIAHDFNNLLTVIKGYAELSSLGLNKHDPLYVNIEEIRKASERAANLTRQLLAFSRRQILEFKVLNLNTLLKDLDRMLHRILGEDIQLVYHLSQDIGKVKTDPGQIEQVILNLAVNARDAMPSGGKLTIETLNIELDEAYARTHMGVSPGQYVMLSVSDTGTGMDSKTRERIFEPFFTTKEKGRGTGLGLSTVYGIVKQSNGNIYVYSEPGVGTTFKIYLPRVEEEEDFLQREDHIIAVSGGNEIILLAEDEPSVRELAARILTAKGYQVYEAHDGKEALNIAQRYPDRKFHLLLTDVVMPGMSGKELADRLKLNMPDLKVLFISGYTDNAIVHHGVLDKGVNFVQKPFTPEALAKKVREVLDQ